MLGWQASGVTSQREAWVLEGQGCVCGWGGCGVGIFMAVHQRFCSGIWIVRRLGGCF